MASKFGRSNSGFGNKSEKEKFLFIAAAGAAFSMVLILIVAAMFKSGGTSAPPVATTGGEATNTNQAGPGEVLLLAPVREVPAGTKLSDVAFSKVKWAKRDIPEGAFNDVAEVQNLFARTKLAAGIPVQRRDTTVQEENVNVPTIALTPGNRAVSIEVDDTSGLEGHALPGAHVDVVLTYTQNGNLVSNIIVQNARVLSYGGDTTPGSAVMRNKAPARKGRTMTLDVSTKDALQIQTARQMGRISLIMRAPDDDAASSTTQFVGQDIGQKSGSKGVSEPACSRGKIKISGKEYIVGCDGSMSPVS